MESCSSRHLYSAAIVLIKIHILFSRNHGTGQLVPEGNRKIYGYDLVVFVVMTITIRQHIIEIAVMFATLRVDIQGSTQ